MIEWICPHCGERLPPPEWDYERKRNRKDINQKGRHIMLNEAFDKVLERVKTLSPGEQCWLQGALDKMLNPQEETKKMKAFHQALLSSGLVKTIKKPRRTSTSERKLIRVQGKPVSETIIEERR